MAQKGNRLVSWPPNKVLKIWILHEFLNQFSVKEIELVSESDGSQAPYRAVFQIHFLSHWLIEICKFKLTVSFEFIHGFSPRYKVFGLFTPFFMHLLYYFWQENTVFSRELSSFWVIEQTLFNTHYIIFLFCLITQKIFSSPAYNTLLSSQTCFKPLMFINK